MNIETLGKWKVGQEVIIQRIHGTNAIERIDKITDGLGGTIFVNKTRYTEAGHERGNSWCSSMIIVATSEEKNKVYRARERRLLQRFDWSSIDDATIQDVYKVTIHAIKAQAELKRMRK